jgi:hypothetical protein
VLFCLQFKSTTRDKKPKAESSKNTKTPWRPWHSKCRRQSNSGRGRAAGRFELRQQSDGGKSRMAGDERQQQSNSGQCRAAASNEWRRKFIGVLFLSE